MNRSTVRSRRLAHALTIDAGDTSGGNQDDTKPDDTSEQPDPESKPAGERTPEEDAAHWKRMARKHEDRAKANHDELEALRREKLTDTEKQLEDARQQARTEALREVGAKFAHAAILAGLTGRGVSEEDAKAEVDDLDLTRFLTEDGDVDYQRVQARIGRAAPQQPKHAGAGTLGMGRVPQQEAKPGAAGLAEAARRYPATNTNGKAQS